jgi:hypothetical protein
MFEKYLRIDFGVTVCKKGQVGSVNETQNRNKDLSAQELFCVL